LLTMLALAGVGNESDARGLHNVETA